MAHPVGLLECLAVSVPPLPHHHLERHPVEVELQHLPELYLVQVLAVRLGAAACSTDIQFTSQCEIHLLFIHFLLQWP